MSIRLLLLLSTVILQFGGTSICQSQNRDANKNVTITTERINDAFHVIAVNKNPFSITLNLDVSGKNYKTNNSLPVEKVLKPNARKQMLTAYLKDSSKGFEFNTRYSWFIGNAFAKHDDSYVYSLPYKKGKAFRIGQGYNGNFSHKNASKYAVDFIMPVGTQVVAARGGTVVQIREDSNTGGSSESYKKHSNFIVIEHSDGTFGEYAHLKIGGALVNVGDRVRRGQLIGLSGNTGYSSGPHLHFVVTKVLTNGNSESLPVKIQTRSGIFADLKEGETYIAL